MERINFKILTPMGMMLLIMVGPRSNNAEEVFQAVVAQDGSGQHKTITEAVSAAPNYSTTRYAIKIKAGVYEERVVVGSEKQNLVFIGDGADRTIINGHRSFASNFSLSEMATVDIYGDHFIAMNISFNNSAGPEAQQAVALRSSADYSAFYMCNFNGYQDTLFVDDGRQFFRNCNIFGSVDFIFGAARAVFQDCNIYVHNSAGRPETVIAAPGKKESPEGSSGISIHKCNIQGAPDQPSNLPLKAFLGRPWRDESTAVYMESTLASIIDPQGWGLFSGEQPTKSVFFGEYHNEGDGSSTNGRVDWAKPGGSLTCSQAEKFTVRNLIQGDTWLPATNIPFDLDLGQPCIGGITGCSRGCSAVVGSESHS